MASHSRRFRTSRGRIHRDVMVTAAARRIAIPTRFPRSTLGAYRMQRGVDMRRPTAIVAAIAILSTTEFARADETIPQHERFVTGGAGLFGSPDGLGILTDFLGAWRMGRVVFGANVQLGYVLFGDRHVAVAPVAGVMMRVPQLDSYWGILGTVGVNYYDGVGRSLGSDDPGFDTTIPYIGVRGLLGGVRGQGAVRFTYALHGFVHADLYRETRTYSYFSSGDGFFLAPGNGPGEVEVTHAAGTFRVGALLALGAAF